MRTAFFNAVTALCAADRRVMLITADLGFGHVERFAARFSEQFLNVGVAEQNLAGVATGLALSGRHVFVYSIGNFPTMRCLEQVRNDICYHRAHVTIVTSGGGLSYGSLGMSHHVTEDLAIMRSLPNMTVIAPGDPIEAGAATLSAARLDGPCYLRLARAGDRNVHGESIDFTIGRAVVVRRGDDVTLISTGGMLDAAVRVADRLRAERSLSVRVLSMHTVKPLDEHAISAAARETRGVVTLEEHSIVGGLGGAVAEVIADRTLSVPFARVALPSTFISVAGSQEYLRSAYGLSDDTIAETIQRIAAVHSALGGSWRGGVG